MAPADEDYYRGLAQLLDALCERVVRYRVHDLEIVYCNNAWASSHDLEPVDLVGRSLGDVLTPGELEGLHQQLALLGPNNPMVIDDVARPAPDAPGRWISWSDQYIDGHVLAVGRDVTEQHLAEARLAESENRFRELAERSADVVWRFTMHPHPHFTYLSPSVESMTGYPRDFLQGDFRNFLALTDDAGRELLTGALHGKELPERYDLHVRSRSGTIVIAEMQITRLPDAVQGVARDVTHIRTLQGELVALALRDPLTGLANRRLLDELLQAALLRTERAGSALQVTFLNLDHFKAVNDTFGHDAGDQVLRETARRLVATARNSDVVARVGGDEFVIVHESLSAGGDVLVQRVREALEAPVRIDERTDVRCPASIGCSDTRTSGRDAATLITVADMAMFQAKRDARAPTSPQVRT